MSPLVFILLALYAGDDLSTSARGLAREVGAAIVHEPAAVSVKNLSTLSAAEIAEVRGIFEAELKSPAGQPSSNVAITVSQNLTEFLIVAEIDRRGERKVLIASWPRTPAHTAASHEDQRVTLEKKLLWEQESPILDAIQTEAGLLVLDAARVLLIRGGERLSAPIANTHPWPRDLRGRLSAGSRAFMAYLPGTVCRGNTAPQLSLDCQDSQAPWLLAPGVLASFTQNSNVFSGHLDLAPGGPRDVPPFYSAAPAGDFWIFAATDGRAHLYNNAWDTASVIDKWGSDIAAIQTPCGARVLATRPTALSGPDAVEVYEMVQTTLPPAGPAVEFSGPVTALWSAGNSATAVARDLETGHYAAFSLVPACGS